MQHPVGYEMVDGKPRADQHRLVAVLLDDAVGLRARAARRVDHRRAGRPRGLRLATAQRRRRRAVRLGPAARADPAVRRPGRGLLRRRRPHARPGRAPADEGRRGRGAVRDRGPCRASASSPPATSPPTRARPTARSRSRICSPCWPRTRGTARCRASTTLNAQYRKAYGPGEYAPVVAVIYWSFRVMVYTWVRWSMFARGRAVAVAQATARTSRRWLKLGSGRALTPFLINTAGWVMTEMGRQPWIVQGLLKTEDGVSPRVSAAARSRCPGRLPAPVQPCSAASRCGSSCGRRSTCGPPTRRRAAGARRSASSRSPTERMDVDYSFLQALWFILIGVLWVGYFVLEGFDFGVGMLLRKLGHTNNDRRAIIHASGRCGTATRSGSSWPAAPPSPRSRSGTPRCSPGFYLALFLILVALIVRGVSFEFWGKSDDPRWRSGWEWATVVSSFARRAAVGRGVGQHRPRRADQRRPGVHRHLVHAAQPVRLLGGVTTLLLFLAHGAIYLNLRTGGDLPERARGSPAGPRRPRPWPASRSSPGRSIDIAGRRRARDRPRRPRGGPARRLGDFELRPPAGPGVRAQRGFDRRAVRHVVRRPVPAVMPSSTSARSI